jgi:hypothetical protein
MRKEDRYFSKTINYCGLTAALTNSYVVMDQPRFMTLCELATGIPAGRQAARAVLLSGLADHGVCWLHGNGSVPSLPARSVLATKSVRASHKSTKNHTLNF